MQMQMKFFIMISTSTMFMLLIFTHLGLHEGTRQRFSPMELSIDLGDRDAFHSGKSDHSVNIVEKPPQKAPSQAVQGADTQKPAASITRIVANSTKPAADQGQPVSEAGKTRPLWASLLLAKAIARIEKPPGTPIKKPRYPAWWTKAWSRSKTSELGDRFLGDQPFFGPCSSRVQTSSVFGLPDPRDYVPTCKNPCWYKDPQLHTGFRCLPYFYLMGVAKCGTADLYRRLRLHPDVMKGVMKEYHWWDRARFGDVYADDLPIRTEKPKGARISLKQYTEQIGGKQGINAILLDLNQTGQSSRIFGDNSPSYFNDVKYWSRLDGNQGCDEPRVTIAQHIRHVTPDVKLVLVVRHPTPRLYLRFLSRVPENLSLRKAASFAFHRLVKKSVSMYKECFERWSIRHCAYNATLYQRDRVKIWEGMYSVFLMDWLRVFPRQQIHVIRYRDLVRDTGPVLTKVFRFLGLSALNTTTMHSLVTEKWVGRREEHELKKYFGPMVPETVDMLNDFYEPFVDKFAEMLNDERFQWRDTDHL